MCARVKYRGVCGCLEVKKFATNIPVSHFVGSTICNTHKIGANDSNEQNGVIDQTGVQIRRVSEGLEAREKEKENSRHRHDVDKHNLEEAGNREAVCMERLFDVLTHHGVEDFFRHRVGDLCFVERDVFGHGAADTHLEFEKLDCEEDGD